MTREVANLIDALIPGVIGLVIIVLPCVIAGKNALDEKITMIRRIGIILVVISIGYVLLKILSR